MSKQVIGIGDIVTAGLKKCRGSERQYITGVIVGEHECGGNWFIVELKSKKGYQHSIPKKLTTLAETA